MIWSLLRKELWHHWVAALFILVLSLGAGGLLVGAILARGAAGTPFEGLRIFVSVFGVLVPLVLCQRLVALEYQAKTQLFLEGLPLTRWRMLAVKYCLGLIASLCIVAAAYAAVTLVSLRRDPPSPGLLSIMSLRGVTYVWCAYSFFFMMGLLGRYRAAIYIGFFLLLVAIQESSSIRLSRFGPFDLVNARFAYEGDVFPWEPLRTTALMALVFTSLALLLGLTREGSVAALLAERMSHREKVFISAFLIGILWMIGVISEKVKRTPFDLLDAASETSEGVTVKVEKQAGEEEDTAARNLARAVGKELTALRAYLQAESLPPVFITSRTDLDATKFERGELENNLGVHVQANYRSKNWSTGRFLPWLIRETLIVASKERAALEERRLVLDGFPQYWITHKSPAAKTRLLLVPQLELRAGYAWRLGVKELDLTQWLTFRERVGDDIACAVGWSALRKLESLAGTNVFPKYVAAALSLGTPQDLRASVGTPAYAWDELMASHTSVSPRDFCREWLAELEANHHSATNDLDRVPLLRATLQVEPLSGASRKVTCNVAIDPAPDKPASYSVLHVPLPTFDEEVDPKSIIREQNIYPLHQRNELPGSFSKGSRLRYTMLLHSDVLGCDIISGWKRITVP